MAAGDILGGALVAGAVLVAPAFGLVPERLVVRALGAGVRGRRRESSRVDGALSGTAAAAGALHERGERGERRERARGAAGQSCRARHREAVAVAAVAAVAVDLERGEDLRRLRRRHVRLLRRRRVVGRRRQRWELYGSGRAVVVVDALATRRRVDWGIARLGRRPLSAMRLRRRGRRRGRRE